MLQDVIHVFCARNKLYKVTNDRSLRPSFNFVLDLVVVQSDLYILTKHLKYLKIIFMFAPCISSIKILFIVPTDAHYYKIVEMLKQFKNYHTCSDMFRFTQEPSSGSSPVLS